jgi:hypothetical protein
MYESAKKYADHILAHNLELNVEDTVHAPSLSKELFGTVDCWAYDDREEMLYIWDLKYGHGEVSVYENWQLICYASGILHKLDVPDHILVKFTIVQPRCFSSDGYIRSWTTTVPNLQPYFTKIKQAIKKALSPEPDTISGSHCRYCSARRVCNAAQQASYRAIDTLHNSIPNELNESQAAQELKTLQDAARAIDNRISGLEAQIESMLRSGKRVPGFSMVQSRGREVWVKTVEEIAALGDEQSVQLRKPLTVLTPNQARNLGMQIGDDITARQTGKLKLKRN